MHPNNLFQGFVFVILATWVFPHPCHNCRTANMDDETAVRMEEAAEQEVIRAYKRLLKQRIMQALSLPSLPEALHPPRRQYPAPLVARMHGVEYDQNSALHTATSPFRLTDADNSQSSPVKEEAYIFGESTGTRDESKPSSCFNFDLKNHKNQTINLQSAELWVYKLEYDEDRPDVNQTLVVSTWRHHHPSQRHPDLRPRILSSQKSHIQRGWVKFDVSRLLRHKLIKASSSVELCVQCMSCRVGSQRHAAYSNVEKYQPFLVMSYETTATKPAAAPIRTKRSQGCRLRSIPINFADLGFQNISVPLGINMGYCFGHCGRENLPVHTGRHAHLMQTVAERRNSDEFLPCCAPTSYRSMSVIYGGGSGSEIIRQNLDKMIADECSCL